MNSPVYVKTAKGLVKLKSKLKDFSDEKINVLKRIDGKKTIDELILEIPEAERNVALKIVNDFVNERIIRALANVDEFDGTTAPIEVMELSDDESMLAWAEANRGSCELKELGFYANPKRAGQSLKLKENEKLHVLIVEDDPSIVQLLTILLEEKGLKVSSVINCADALAALRKKESPHFLLLDVVLPSESGFNILAAIRQSSDLCHVPIFMLTSQISDENVLQGLNGGADGYIFKPFKWQTVYRSIQALTGI